MSRELRAAKKRQRAGRHEASPPVRRSIFDPLVLAAVVALVSGTGIKIADEVGQSGRAQVEAIATAEEGDCERAYRYLQAAAENPRLREDREFYELNRETAKRCALPGAASLQGAKE